VELVDIDGDTDLEVVTSEQIEQLGIVWYENPTIAIPITTRNDASHRHGGGRSVDGGVETCAGR
jgi:hypothetical protein